MAKPIVTGIHEIVNLVNGKKYIGSAVNMDSRWATHRSDLNRGDHHSVALQRAWKKYGENSFEFRVRLDCTKDQLLVFEQSAIDLEKPEYNIAKVAGSTMGVKMSDVAKEKMRIVRTGTKMSDETRAKISAAQVGRKMSPESIAKRSASRTGVRLGPLSDDHKKKISDANRGRSITEEHKAAISRANSGRPRPDMIGNSYGRHTKSAELRAQMSAARKGVPKSEETRERMRLAWVKRRELSAA